MTKIYPFFSLRELKCKCGMCNSGGLEMDDEFMTKLVELRLRCGWPFIVTSAYRCPTHNERVSSSGKNGPHTTGKAIDISVRGERALELISGAIELGFTGIGVNQKGSNRFVHLDTLRAPKYPRPNIWSY